MQSNEVGVRKVAVESGCGLVAGVGDKRTGLPYRPEYVMVLEPKHSLGRRMAALTWQAEKKRQEGDLPRIKRRCMRERARIERVALLMQDRFVSWALRCGRKMHYAAQRGDTSCVIVIGHWWWRRDLRVALGQALEQHFNQQGLHLQLQAFENEAVKLMISWEYLFRQMSREALSREAARGDDE